ncbi:hypothetical protein SADUNF_Sadunf02G0001500 [Salix dunnii]|uniref:Uncharacterized protein n=1 Tax=Salix dunnii TaxID=1413687 RepID=A0A835N5A3_9ROSI|nr:hypothetical protein SADUNF_Sadunf02G0001500 [Salix dunnii]
MAYHAWFFGPISHFVFHDDGGVSPEVRAALEPWVRAGRATVEDIRGQAEFDGYYYNQFLVCIYLPEGNTLESVLKEFSNYTPFTNEQNPMSSALCFNDSTQDNPGTGIRRDRKYATPAKNAYATGVHMSENVIGLTLHKTETKIRYYHYHNSIHVLGELCREFLPLSAKDNVTWYNKLPYVYDDSMKKNESNTIGSVHSHS